MTLLVIRFINRIYSQINLKLTYFIIYLSEN